MANGIYRITEEFEEKLANYMAPKEYKKVTTGDILIKKYSLVGCYTVILPSVTLEHASAVGAHSLVKKSTAPFDIIAGAPAKFITKRKNVYLN
jgi:galactoside O-acetyltransferase